MADLEKFWKDVEKKYGAGTVMRASEAKALKVRRFSTGLFAVDYAFGGGFPIGRAVMIYGPKSSGKSTLAMIIVGMAQKTCKVCLEFVEDCTCKGKPKPFVCYWADLEGDFEPDWATDFGVNLDALWLSKPESGEEAADTVHGGLATGELDLVVVNSLAHMVPTKEVAESIEHFEPALQARLLNKFFRKIASTLNAPSLTEVHRPSILLINQIRFKVGVIFGSPETKPGGEGQGFYSTIEMRVKSDKYEFDDDKLAWLANTSFETQKNKVFVNRIKGAFRFVLRNHEEMKRGETFEEMTVFAYANKYGLIEGGKGKPYSIAGREFRVQDDVKAALRSDDKFFREVRKMTLGVMLA